MNIFFALLIWSREVPKVFLPLLHHFGLVLGLSAVLAGLTYGLALIALYEMEQERGAVLPPETRGEFSITEGDGGAPQIWRGEASLGLLRGHKGPVTTAALFSDEKGLLTASLDGSARLTDIEASTLLRKVTAPKLRSAIYNVIWKPYGQLLAQKALWLTAQVLSLHIPETRKGQRGRLFRDCPDCPEMVELEGGLLYAESPLVETQHDGSESSRHLVEVKPFAISKFTVTFAEWDACTAVGGCPRVYDWGWGRGNRPVIRVSWNEANQYAEWLGAITGESYRLLTEVEWEYAARAGTTTAYFWGNEIGQGNANCIGCGSEWDGKQVAPVGSFKPNAFGLFDMHGNVWQWTGDCSIKASNNPRTNDSTTFTENCGRRAIRGGSWRSSPRFLRAMCRDAEDPSIRAIDVGFRVARMLGR